MIDPKWPVFISILSSLAACSYYRKDPRVLLLYGLQIIIQVGVVLFGIGFVCWEIKKAFLKKNDHVQEGLDQSDAADKYESKRKKARDEEQSKMEEKGKVYREKILVPREEEKKRQKEEEFRRFMGPAWKGRGDLLGGEDTRPAFAEGALSAGTEARQIRRLPPDVKLHIPKPPDTKKKRVLELPAEPAEGAPDVTVIVLRTPIGTKHKRRFLKSDTLQVVLDYMTSVGFHQAVHTLSMTYPRRPLIDQSEITLHELGFGSQMILNIEEKNI